MATWKQLIEEVTRIDGDVIIASTLTEEELNREFCDGFGLEKGCPFTAWSEKYVYFPVCYDGAEWVSRAPRNPCSEKMNHVGG